MIWATLRALRSRPAAGAVRRRTAQTGLQAVARHPSPAPLSQCRSTPLAASCNAQSLMVIVPYDRGSKSKAMLPKTAMLVAFTPAGQSADASDRTFTASPASGLVARAGSSVSRDAVRN